MLLQILPSVLKYRGDELEIGNLELVIEDVEIIFWARQQEFY